MDVYNQVFTLLSVTIEFTLEYFSLDQVMIPLIINSIK